jgi:hypothetical protein
MRSVSGNVNTISLKKLSGIMTTAQAEMLLDSLYYQNTSFTPTVGARMFNVSIREGSFTSPITVFDMSEICLLPVRWLGFSAVKDAKGQVKLDWQVADEGNVVAYEIECSNNGMQWRKMGQVQVEFENIHSGRYTFSVMQSFSGRVYFRIRQVDLNGQYGFSVVKFLDFSNVQAFRFWPNPAVSQVQVEANEPGELQLLDLTGKCRQQLKVLPGYVQYIQIESLPRGIYVLRFQDTSGKVQTSRLLRN